MLEILVSGKMRNGEPWSTFFFSFEDEENTRETDDLETAQEWLETYCRGTYGADVTMRVAAAPGLEIYTGIDAGELEYIILDTGVRYRLIFEMVGNGQRKLYDKQVTR